MLVFNLISLLLSLIILIVLIIGIVRYISQNRRDKKKVLQLFLAIGLLVSIVVIPITVVEHFIPKSTLRAIEDEDDSFSPYDILKTADTTLEQTTEVDYKEHFDEVMAVKRIIESENRFYNRPLSDYKDYWVSKNTTSTYTTYAVSSDSIQRDMGHLFAALHFANLGLDQEMIWSHIDQISNKDIPYLHYTKGVSYLAARSWAKKDSVELELKTSLETEDCQKEAYKTLAEFYYYFSEDEKLDSLVYNAETNPHIPFWLKRTSFFVNMDISNYWKTVFIDKFGSITLGIFLSAFIITLFWVFFFRKMDFYEPEKWRYLILTFLLSLVCMQLLYPIHDFLWNVFNYYRPNDAISDLLYITVSTGMTEELVKILPVLIVLKLTKAINEPFDYILYPSIAALGFAFIENMSYFEDGNIFNIGFRGIICCIAHAAFSATIGYGLMLAKYRKGYNKFILFGLFFLIASALHGLYDFWIMN